MKCNHNKTQDLDLHRYQCLDCAKILFYSQKARQYWEEGKKFPGIKGLED